MKSLKPRGYNDTPETLGEHLRKRRIQLGLWQKQVAKQLLVGECTYLKWERDRAKPAARFIPRIIHFLGYDLFSRAENKSRPSAGSMG